MLEQAQQVATEASLTSFLSKSALIGVWTLAGAEGIGSLIKLKWFKKSKAVKPVAAFIIGPGSAVVTWKAGFLTVPTEGPWAIGFVAMAGLFSVMIAKYGNDWAVKPLQARMKKKPAKSKIPE